MLGMAIRLCYLQWHICCTEYVHIVICEGFTHVSMLVCWTQTLMLIHCVVAQAVLEAVKVGDTQISMLTPAVLRQSLRKAGKVVEPSEVTAILEYVISDEQFEDLHGLYLVHLRTGEVTCLSWQGKQEDQMGAKKLFIACNKRSAELLELMCFNKAILLEPSAAWEKLARCQSPPLTCLLLGTCPMCVYACPTAYSRVISVVCTHQPWRISVEIQACQIHTQQVTSIVDCD